MNTEHLAIFINLAETLSFSGTAMNMGVSQSAVSQTISSMERYIGADLFYRTRKKVSLTPVGKAFYEDIRPVHHNYVDTLRQLEALNEQARDKITIGISNSPYEIFALSKSIKAYQAENPKVQFYIESHNNRDLVGLLNEGALDIVFLSQDSLSPSANVKFKPLLTGRYCAVFQQDYDFAIRGSVKHSDLDKQRVIFLSDNICTPGQYSLQKILWQELPHLKVTSANSINAAMLSIKAGLGIGILPNFLLPDQLKDLTVVPLSGKNEVSYGTAIPERTMSTASQAFYDWLEESKLPAMHELA
ncbi:LysR family transcriptional regulator [Lactobacillus delbrueckii]|uniref:LysR family transcriptional regulator n=1 Tax=Lactobacillus delbrueckii TaxID=1584 RepID=UPI0039947160